MVLPRKPNSAVSIGTQNRGAAKRSDRIPGSSESDTHMKDSRSSDAARRGVEPGTSRTLTVPGLFKRLHLFSVSTGSPHYFPLLIRAP